MKNVAMLDVKDGMTRGLGVLEVTQAAKKVALPLAKVDIRGRVADRVAQVTVEQTFRNPNTEALEAVYIFPLPGGCAVSAFEMKVGDRVIKGVVKERGQARAEYQQAIEDGKRAALLEQERDDVFTVQVGNLPPGEEVSVVISYSEKLPFFENGSTELRLPLVLGLRYIPGQALDRHAVGHGTAPDTDVVPDASRITPPRLAEGFNPETDLAIDVTMADDAAELSCSQHATKSSFSKDGLTVKLAKKDELLNRDFVLRWRLSGEGISSRLMVCDGHAMLSILPPKRDGFLGLARDVVFVLDRSGSMGGAKMTSAARACAMLLNTLGPRDRYAIQAFDDRQDWMSEGWTPADEGGLEAGEKWLRGIDARGGTEMDGALAAALKRVGQRKDADARTAVILFITDGQVGDESRILKRVQTEAADVRIFSVGVDTAVNEGFLTRIAALGGGTASFVVPGDELEDALRAVGREIGAPLVTDLRIEGGVEEIAPARMPDLFAGRAAAVFFKMKKAGRVTVHGKLPDGKPWSQAVKPEEVDLPALAHLWARTRVSELEDQFRLAGGKDSIQKEIIKISVLHTLLTRFTAFVVVDESEIVNKDGSRKTVIQPVHMPDRWEMEKSKECKKRAPAGPMKCMAAPANHGAGLRGGKCAEAEDCSVAPPPVPTAAEIEAVRKALEALLKAWADAKAAVDAGRMPASEPLKRAKKDLVAALAKGVIGQRLAKLQAFLRTGLAEVLVAITHGAALKPIIGRHNDALDEAWKEFEDAVAGGKKSPAFWETSV
jgi:Ca-activated chloride channel family protein